MSKENDKKEEQTDIPAWLHPEHDRKEPYTDEELDVFVEHYLEALVDAPAWNNVVAKMGIEAAKQALKDGIKNQANIERVILQLQHNLN
jgi:hypothetical protein